MEQPPDMTVTPHDYQLEGAARAHHLCRSEVRGALIGDERGLGKTLLAILVIWLTRNDPGFVLVACPSPLCGVWKLQIERAFERVSFSCPHANIANDYRRAGLHSGRC